MDMMQVYLLELDEPQSLYSEPSAIVESTNAAIMANATNITRATSTSHINNTNVHPINSNHSTGSDSITLDKPHPHAGARSANGSRGYVADVYRVRKHIINQYHSAHGDQTISLPPSYLPLNTTSKEFNDVCNTPPKEGPERKAGYRLLSTKVHVNASVPINNNNLNQTENFTMGTETSPTKTTKPLRILCAIYTYEGGHFRLRGVRDTWAWRCDGFFAASTKTIEDPTDVGFGAIELRHIGPEKYENMWQKVRSIWSYMYDNYLEDFDYFYLCGDDTHLIVENLRNYLASIHNPEYPAYLGQFIRRKSSFFVGGGPGYVLNRKALKILVEDVFPVCRINTIIAAEDRFMSDCFRDTVGLEGNHTVDEFGAQRFHGMDPHFMASFKGTRGYFKGVYDFWGSLYGYRTGLDLVSTQSVSFHLLKTPLMMKRHHAILYRSCPLGTELGDALQYHNVG